MLIGRGLRHLFSHSFKNISVGVAICWSLRNWLGKDFRVWKNSERVSEGDETGEGLYLNFAVDDRTLNKGVSSVSNDFCLSIRYFLVFTFSMGRFFLGFIYKPYSDPNLNKIKNQIKN